MDGKNWLDPNTENGYIYYKMKQYSICKYSNCSYTYKNHHHLINCYSN